MYGTHEAYGIENDETNEWNIPFFDLMGNNTKIRIETGNGKYGMEFTKSFLLDWNETNAGATQHNGNVTIPYVTWNGMTYKDHPSQWYMRKSASENGMWPFDVVDGDKNIEFEGDPLLFISGTWSSGGAAPYPNNPAANQDNGDVHDGPLALIYSEKGYDRSDNPTISNMKNENNGIYVFLKLDDA